MSLGRHDLGKETNTGDMAGSSAAFVNGDCADPHRITSYKPGSVHISVMASSLHPDVT